MKTDKRILDVCCGGRMFHFDKSNPDVLYCDIRTFDGEIWRSKDGTKVRRHTVAPDVVCDVTALPFADDSFYHVIFDPPHLTRVGDNSWTAKKYGKLPEDRKAFIKAGFDECWRVLKTNGTLNFKWNEENITVSAVIGAIGRTPIYGTRTRGKTHWFAFVK